MERKLISIVHAVALALISFQSTEAQNPVTFETWEKQRLVPAVQQVPYQHTQPYAAPLAPGFGVFYYSPSYPVQVPAQSPVVPPQVPQRMRIEYPTPLRDLLFGRYLQPSF